MRKFIFKDTVKNKEFVLPVTPPSFEVSHGINVETINIHTLGDVILPGYSTLATIKIDCLFPAHKYPFNQPDANLDPYSHVKRFAYWCDKHTILRFIVSGTSVNVPVIVQETTYGEKDGTGDIYAAVSLREYKNLAAAGKTGTGNRARNKSTSESGTKSYKIKSGDTLGAICRKQYGDPSLYSKLATYNGIKNPNLIVAGKTLKIPDKSLL